MASRATAATRYLTLPADAVAPKPEALSFAAAASCGVPFVTAWYALENTRVGAGTKLVAIGAAGGVGIATIHLARLRGAEVLCAVRRAEHARTLEKRGFATLLVEEGQALGPAVRRHFPKGADVVFDTTGYWLAQSIDALGQYGRAVPIAVPAQDGYVNLPIRDLYRRGGSIVGVNSLLYAAGERARMLELIAPDFEPGRLIAPEGIIERPLEEGVAVYAALREGSRGKFVLIP